MNGLIPLSFTSVKICMMLSEQEFLATVQQANSWHDLCKKLHAPTNWRSRQKLQTLATTFNIDCDAMWKAKKANRSFQAVGRPQGLRRALLRSGRKEHCEECGQLPVWNDKQLTLNVDHVNGNNTDHREENLRFLCPNCHSQTPTFAGRNKRKHILL